MNEVRVLKERSGIRSQSGHYEVLEAGAVLLDSDEIVSVQVAEKGIADQVAKKRQRYADNVDLWNQKTIARREKLKELTGFSDEAIDLLGVPRPKEVAAPAR